MYSVLLGRLGMGERRMLPSVTRRQSTTPKRHQRARAQQPLLLHTWRALR